MATESLAEDSVFTTDLGWEIHLQEAKAALAPLYLYAPGSQPLTFLRELMVPIAQAHSGTDPLAEHIVLAEWNEQTVLDLLSNETQYLGSVTAEAGAVEKATLILQPPAAAHDTLMHGYHFWVRGEASKDGQTVAFEGGLDLPNTGLTRRVEPIPVDGMLAEGTTIVLGLDPRTWFEGAHFERLAATASEETHIIHANSQVRGAWFLGARDLSGYRIRLETELGREQSDDE